MTRDCKCRNMLCIWLLLGVSVTVMSQQPTSTSPQNVDVMLAAVSRDDSMFVGGIETSKWTGQGIVSVEPLALLTSSGKWMSLPCDASHPAMCRRFEREYLRKPHSYTVISAGGQGTEIHTAPVSLGDCYEYDGMGRYSGSDIEYPAIAASSTGFFADSSPVHLLGDIEAKPILNALAALTPVRLDSVLYLRLFSVQLEGQGLIVVQRAFSDYGDKPNSDSLQQIFAIGAMRHGKFEILQWKQNVMDEEERVLGAIRLKNGREFLITSVNDAEGQWFRVYGISEGKLAIIYKGGGSSC
jgi:hypothetical protein